MANLSNINNKFLVTTGGNVLIGGTAVVGTAKLQVTGEARVYTGSNLGYWGVDAGNSYVYLGTNSSAYGLSLQTGGIDRVNINDAGNVFISTPITNAFYGLSLTYNNTNTADFTVNQATGQIKIGGVATGYFPTFYAGGSEKMRVESDGIISIGEGATQSWIYNKVQVTTTAVSGKQSMSNIDRTTANWMRITNPVYSTNGSVGLIMRTFPNSDARQGAGIIASGGSDNAATDLDLFVSQQTSGATTSTSYSALSIKGNTGNVGIGTDSPGSKLDVEGTVFANGEGNGFMLDAGTAATARTGFMKYGGYEGMIISGNTTKVRLGHRTDSDYVYGGTPTIREDLTIDTAGNVGIGTTLPVKKLQVSDSATGLMTNLLLTNTHDTNGDTTGIAFSMTDNDLFNKAGIVFERQTTQGRGSLHFCNNNTNGSANFTLADAAMTIEYTGEVGIGTTLPSKKLEVAGSYKLGTNAYIQYDAGYPYTINMLNTAAVGNLILNAGAGSSGYESKIELQGSNTAGAAGITLSTAGSTRMVITADGKIGLDKSDPFYSVDATSFGAATHEWGSGLSVFGQDRYSIRELNNLFYSADTRVGGIGTSSNLVNTMFDGNFDTGHGIAANTTYVVELDGSGAWNMTYPSGYAIISFYYVYNNFTSIVGEQYHYSGTYAGQWRTMGTATTIRGSAGGGGRVVRINSVGNNYVSKWRFTFVTGSTSITVTDIAFYTTRTAGAPVSVYMRGDRTNEWTRMIRFRNDAYGIVGSINPGNTSTTFNTTSDYRLKEDLKDFKGLDMVSKIPVYDFRWINSEKRSYGVLAHELNEIYPEAVEGEKDEKENQCVDYSKIVPLLVKSIQELKAEIELLKSK